MVLLIPIHLVIRIYEIEEATYQHRKRDKRGKRGGIKFGTSVSAVIGIEQVKREILEECREKFFGDYEAGSEGLTEWILVADAPRPTVKYTTFSVVIPEQQDRPEVTAVEITS